MVGSAVAARLLCVAALVMLSTVPAGAGTTTSNDCTHIPPPVPRTQLPPDVRDWAGGGPMIGTGPIWLYRGAIAWDRTAKPWLPRSDGTYAMGKVAWFMRDGWDATPAITGRRMDGPGTFSARINGARSRGYDWYVSSLEFSAPGCWKVTGSWKSATVTFRIQVGRPGAGDHHRGVVCRAVPAAGVEVATPQFVGKSVAAAGQLACDTGTWIEWEREPRRMDGVVRSQDPEAGTLIVGGDSVMLDSAPPR